MAFACESLNLACALGRGPWITCIWCSFSCGSTCRRMTWCRLRRSWAWWTTTGRCISGIRCITCRKLRAGGEVSWWVRGVLGVLDVILDLMFRLGHLVNQLEQVDVGLKVHNLLDGVTESIKKVRHGLLFGFLHIDADHSDFYLLVVLFDYLGLLVPCFSTWSFLKR